MKLVAFDLETAKAAPKDRNGDYNLGITCIGAHVVDGDERQDRTWKGGEELGCYSKQMAQWPVNDFINWLGIKARAGFDIVSWNGLGFDFRVLAQGLELEQYDNLVDLALNSIDPFYQMLCEKGFGIGLNTAADGLELSGKMEGMDGLKAMEMWCKSREAQETVLEYVLQDALTTADVYRQMVKRGTLPWTSKSGCPNRWFINGCDTHRLLTVRDATSLPVPDTSWMSKPWKRSDFYGWTGWNPEKKSA